MVAMRDVGSGPRRGAARRTGDSQPGSGTRALDATLKKFTDAADSITSSLDAIGRQADTLRQRAEDRAFTAGAAQMADRMAFDAGWNDSVQCQRKQLADTQAAADAFYRRNGK